MQIAKDAMIVMKNRAGLEPIRDAFGFVTVRCPDGGAQTELTLIRSDDCLVFVGKPENRDDRPELFTADDLVFLPGMSALIAGRLTPQAAHEAMLSGARYGADDALRLGIADATSAEGALVTAAAERAAALAGKNPATVSGIKAGLYGEIVAKLREPIAT